MADAKGFFEEDLNEEFFTAVSKARGCRLITWKKLDDVELGTHTNSQVIGEANKGRRLSGFFPFCVFGEDALGTKCSFEVIVKVKVPTYDMIAAWILTGSQSEPDSMKLREKYFLTGVHVYSELEVYAARYALKDSFFCGFRPRVYHTVLDFENGKFAIVMELFRPEDVAIGGSITYKGWDEEKRYTVLRELAKFHAHYMENTDTIKQEVNGLFKSRPREHLEALPLWRDLSKTLVGLRADLFSPEVLAVIESYFDNLGRITAEEETYPMTFVHGDTHPGNMWLRKTSKGGCSELILCDWETCCIHVPQRDLIQFLRYSIYPAETAAENLQLWVDHIEYYRKQLIAAIYRENKELLYNMYDEDMFYRILDYQVLEVHCSRVLLGAIMPQRFQKLYTYAEGARNILLYIQAMSKRFKTYFKD